MDLKMLFGFFLRTNKTLGLLSKTGNLSRLPQLCSSGSNLIPHILKPINQVIPKLINISEVSHVKSTYFIPMFVAMRNNQILEEPEGTFYLIFYPNPENPPVTHKNENRNRLIQEYWSSIKPMFICRNVSGYYLGCADDPGVVLFTKCSEETPECLGWLRQAEKGVNVSTCYDLVENVEFGSNRIYLCKTKTGIKFQDK